MWYFYGFPTLARYYAKMMTINNPFRVCVTSSQEEASALSLEILAKRLNLPFKPAVDSNNIYSASLTLQDDALKLIGNKQAGTEQLLGSGVWVDFIGGRVGYRLKFGEGKNQPIAKAVGIKGQTLPHVMDCTAGMGRDAFVLASLGCEVTMIERSPIIHALLEDGLRRALDDKTSHPIAQRMNLVHAHAIDVLGKAEIIKQANTVIYLDPMYPHKQKSALVKKEMRVFRELVGDDMDAGELLNTATHSDVARVVVKRPKNAPTLTDKKPTMAISSKNTRYDVYVKRKLI